MPKKVVFIAILFVLVSLISCTTMPSTMRKPSATDSGPRTLILDGMEVTEDELVGPFTSWYAIDFVYEGPILIEVGYFSNTDVTGLGYILFDGGHEGKFTLYERQGVNHRWDWGDDLEYSFIIKPDNTGLYYDFTGTKGTTSADDVYKCYKW